ncbi:MAG: 3-deoxy-manno-octulosonate cytidylyltransferase [Gammaproteobacteria bacterium]
MGFVVVIPARYSSSRLPGKPLAEIAGRTMIEHVYRQAQRSRAREVVVATDDQRVADAVQAFGGTVCMTAATHPSGTDRIEEVARKMGYGADDIVVNVQGDEPLIPPQNIDQVAANLAANARCSAATLCEEISSPADVFNPNIVKLVAAASGEALYFSRAVIPWDRDGYAKLAGGALPASVGDAYRRHIGIYAYRVSLLGEFVGWGACPLENIEALEQLRILWNGHRIHVATAAVSAPGGVDTPADLERVRQHFVQAGNG